MTAVLQPTLSGATATTASFVEDGLDSQQKRIVHIVGNLGLAAQPHSGVGHELVFVADRTRGPFLIITKLRPGMTVAALSDLDRLGNCLCVFVLGLRADGSLHFEPVPGSLSDSPLDRVRPASVVTTANSLDERGIITNPSLVLPPI